MIFSGNIEPNKIAIWCTNEKNHNPIESSEFKHYFHVIWHVIFMCLYRIAVLPIRLRDKCSEQSF